MRIHSLASSVLLLGGAVFLVTACGSKDNGASGSSSPSSKAAGSSKAGGKKGKKPAMAKPADAKQAATKGDAANATKPIPTTGKVTQIAKIDKKEEKKVEHPVDKACEGVPDGVGVCAVNKLLFCMSSELYEIDCDEHGRMTGFTGGTCLETDKGVDCMSITPDVDPAEQVYCDPAANYCCDANGFCWGDPNGGDDTSGDSAPAESGE